MRWVAVVLVAAVVGVACSGAPEGPRPKVFRGEPSSAIYEPIGSRAVDSEPLTQGEVFGQESVGSMRRGQVTESGNCAGAVWGSAPLAGCTQVLRAVYGADGVSGQFTIFNLADSAAADRLAAAFAKDAFVRVAPGQPTVDGGSAQVRALGHYVVVSWVAALGDETPDLTDPLLAVDSISRFLQTRLLAD